MQSIQNRHLAILLWIPKAAKSLVWSVWLLQRLFLVACTTTCLLRLSAKKSNCVHTYVVGRKPCIILKWGFASCRKHDSLSKSKRDARTSCEKSLPVSLWRSTEYFFKLLQFPKFPLDGTFLQGININTPKTCKTWCTISCFGSLKRLLNNNSKWEFYLKQTKCSAKVNTTTT